MNATTNTIRIGNVITGTYHGVDLIGRVTGWDGGKRPAWVLTLDAPVTIYGIERDSVLVSAREAHLWTVVDATVAESEMGHGTSFVMCA